MAQRNQFRARRRAGRVEQKRNVVGLSKSRLGLQPDRIAFDPEAAGGSVPQRDQPQHADAEALGNGHRRTGLILGDEDRFDADVGQVEIEFIGAVGWIERRGRGRRGDRNERRRHLRPIRQHDCDAIPTADAARVQLPGGLPDQTAKAAMGERGPVRRRDRRRVVATAGNPFNDRSGVRQRGPRDLQLRRHGP